MNHDLFDDTFYNINIFLFKKKTTGRISFLSIQRYMIVYGPKQIPIK